MKKVILILTFLIISTILDSTEYKRLSNNTLNNQIITVLNKTYTNELIKVNIKVLKTKQFNNNSRSEVFNLVYPVLMEYSKQYTDSFELTAQKLTQCITVLFISESSTHKGITSSNSLFREYNNPFGIKGNDINLKTWEEINKERVYMKLNFRSFSDLEEAVKYLFESILLKPRFKQLKKVKTANSFFDELYQHGYMTASTWPNFAKNILKKHGNKIIN